MSLCFKRQKNINSSEQIIDVNTISKLKQTSPKDERMWGIIYEKKKKNSISYLTRSQETIVLTKNGMLLKKPQPLSWYKKIFCRGRHLFIIQSSLVERSKRIKKSKEKVRKKNVEVMYIIKKLYPGEVLLNGEPMTENSIFYKTKSKIEIMEIKLSLVFEALCDVEENKAVSSFPIRMISLLGKGGFGCVHKAVMFDNARFCAVKSSFEKTRIQLNEEFKILSELHHDNVIKCFSFTKHDNKVFLVLELAEGGTLKRQMVKMTEKQSKIVLKQVCAGILYLHEKGIIHRDIKPENIVLMKNSNYWNNQRVKLIDFSCSCRKSDKKKLSHTAGTFKYMAPEMIETYIQPNKDKRVRHSELVDVWSLGVVAFRILAKTAPYGQDNDTFLRKKDRKLDKEEKIKRAKLFRDVLLSREINTTTNEYQRLSEEGKSFLGNCLEVNVSNRPSAKELVKNPWFQVMKQNGSSSEIY